MDKFDNMERLDRGHLYPKLEAPRLTYLGWELNPGLGGGRIFSYNLTTGTLSSVLKIYFFAKILC